MKTDAFYIEKSLGPLIAGFAVFICYHFWSICSFIAVKDFFDKLIAISTTLFGFLLTVLTLLIQADGVIIGKMKEHGSFQRMISKNKTVVLLFVVVACLSLILCVYSERIKDEAKIAIRVPSLVVFFLFVWAMVDTIIFTLVFYRVIRKPQTQS